MGAVRRGKRSSRGVKRYHQQMRGPSPAQRKALKDLGIPGEIIRDMTHGEAQSVLEFRRSSPMK